MIIMINYSYRIMGSKIRIYPMPTGTNPMPKLFISVTFNPDPFNPDIEDGTIYGASNMSNVPYGLFDYSKVNFKYISRAILLLDIILSSFFFIFLHKQVILLLCICTCI